jgi:hypothetical protein
LAECAWAATRTKNTYLKSKYYSLVGRRGKKRALIAISHKILAISYHILKNKVPYKELGVSYLDERKKDKLTRNYKKRLAKLGYEVILKKVA